MMYRCWFASSKIYCKLWCVCWTYVVTYWA